MKKSVFLAVMATIILWTTYAPEKASAYPGGLLQGIPGYSSRNGAWHYAMTDGNTATWNEEIFYLWQYGEFTLPSPVELVKWQIAASGAIYAIGFYDENKTELYTSGNRTGSQTVLIEQPVSGVKYVRIWNTDTRTNRLRISEFDVFPDTSPPGTPTGVVATPSNGQTLLQWNPVADASAGYHVYVDGLKVTEAPIKATSYAAAVSNNVTHSFAITAVKNSGIESPKSTAVTSFWDDTTPAKPTGLTATPSYGKAELKWNANPPDSNFLGYNVYLDGVKVTDAPITAKAYTVSMTNDVMHNVGVSAVGKNGHESEKALTGAYWDGTPPAKPTGLLTAAGTGKGFISYNENTEPDLKGYNLYLDGKKVTPAPITARTYTYNGLENERMYVAEVTAVDVSGNESARAGGVFTTIPPDETPPGKPAGLKATGGNREALIEWKKNPEPDVLGYFIFVDGVKKTENPISGLYAYVLPGLINGHTYSIQLQAVDTSGNLSPLSSPVSVFLTPTAPDRPAELSIISGDRKANISWSTVNSQAVKHYEVYRNGTKVATVTDGDAYEDTGLFNGIAYQYKVIAVNDDGQSEPSIGYALYAPPPAPPTPGSLEEAVKNSSWGFTSGDIWKNVITIVATLGAFILLGILITHARQVMRVIRSAIARMRGARS